MYDAASGRGHEVSVDCKISGFAINFEASPDELQAYRESIEEKRGGEVVEGSPVLLSHHDNSVIGRQGKEVWKQDGFPFYEPPLRDEAVRVAG